MPDYNRVDKWPIFDAEKANEIDAEKYRLQIDGLVEEPFEMSLEEIKALPRAVKNLRLTSVSGWSVRADWEGVVFSDVLAKIKRKPGAAFANFHSKGGKDKYTSCVAMKDLTLPNTMLVYGANGRALRHEEGAPVRMLIPHLWGYKGVKWLVRIEFTDKTVEGYWETRGYPNEAPIQPGSIFDVNSRQKRQISGGEITEF